MFLIFNSHKASYYQKLVEKYKNYSKRNTRYKYDYLSKANTFKCDQDAYNKQLWNLLYVLRKSSDYNKELSDALIKKWSDLSNKYYVNYSHEVKTLVGFLKESKKQAGVQKALELLWIGRRGEIAHYDFSLGIYKNTNKNLDLKDYESRELFKALVKSEILTIKNPSEDFVYQNAIISDKYWPITYQSKLDFDSILMTTTKQGIKKSSPLAKKLIPYEKNILDYLKSIHWYRFSKHSEDIIKNRYLLSSSEVKSQLENILWKEFFKNLNARTKPLAVMLLSVNDSIGAFESIPNYQIANLFEKYHVIFYDIGSDNDLKGSLLEATRNSNSKEKADLLIISGHGQQNAMNLSYAVYSDDIWFAVDDVELIQDLSDTVKDSGTVMLFSCSTGKGREKEENLANFVHKIWPKTYVFSPVADYYPWNSILNLNSTARPKIIYWTLANYWDSSIDQTYVIDPN